MAYTSATLVTMGPHGQMVGWATAPNPDIVREWTYKTTDAIATVNTAAYFSDAGSKGVQKGDFLRVVVMSGSTVSAAYTCVFMGVTAGAGDISDGVSVTLTNTD